MRLGLDCIPCMLRQSLMSARRATSDPQVQERVLREVMAVLGRANWRATPMDLGSQVHHQVREITGEDDPFEQDKRQANAQALELYPKLRKLVEEAEEPLRTAAKLAIAGNIMDLGALEVFDVEDTIKRVLASDFALDDFEAFRAQVASARQVLYLADNAGEIIFDRLLLEQMCPAHLIVAVKNEPFINDAMVTDAEQAGLDKLAELLPIAPGRVAPAEFGPVWSEADLIVAKGQANYESYSETPGPVYFLLLAKCALVAGDAGVQVGDMILQSQATRNAGDTPGQGR